ncbi:lysostaphin resistance A-like protein [Eubacterium sp.]|uniref:CPBP family intramembrane glutamic endopeptidase n=1 Tax=Eubacterium sp. TaxID=142586 RepID=UPI003520FC35
MDSRKRERVTIGRIWGLIYPMLLYLGVTFAVEFIFMIVVAVLGISRYGVTDRAQLYDFIMNATMSQALSMTLLAGLATAPILIFIYIRDNNKDRRNGTFVKYKLNNILKYLLIIPFGVFNMLWANYFVALLQLVMPKFMLESYTDTQQIIEGGGFLIQLLTAGIVAPIVEELIFRGLVYRRTKKMTGTIAAAILSAALFGVFHGNWVQAPYAFIIGIVAVFVYEKFKSIVAPIMLHMSANILSVLIMTMTSSDTPTVDSLNIDTLSYVSSLIIFIFITGVLAAVFGVIIWNKVNPVAINAKKENEI